MVRESWSTEDEREEKPPEIGWSTQRATSTGVTIRVFICLCVLVSIYVRMCERGDVTYLVAWSIPSRLLSRSDKFGPESHTNHGTEEGIKLASASSSSLVLGSLETLDLGRVVKGNE